MTLPQVDATLLAAAVALAVALVVPGWLALELTRHPARGFDRLGMSVGVSASLVPVALLWSRVVGVQWSATGVRVTVAVLVCVLGVAVLRRLRADAAPRTRPGPASLALLVVLLIAAVLRVVHVQDLVASPWVDGYHHTLIATLVLEKGGIPSGFAPYLPVDRFYYHFGFHAIAAAVSWLSDVPARLTVLWTGQAMNGLAALTVYVLARRCLRHDVAAVAAAAVPATMYWFPSYFASWGRNTQLTGLVVLPIAWILLADAAGLGSTQRAGRARIVALAGIVAAGLLLIHYRVFVFYVLGAAVIAVGSMLDPGERRRRLFTYAGAGAVAAVLVAPWLVGDLLAGARALAATSVSWFGGQSGVADVPGWLFTTGLNGLLIAVAVRGVAVGLARRSRAAVALVVVAALTFAAVDPRWIGLPSSWTLPPFSLAITAYLPVAIGIGFLVDAVLDFVRPYSSSTKAAAAVAGLVVIVALYGASVTRSVVNPSTVILEAADLDAADWVSRNTEPDARFLVSTAHWHLGTYRGLDGGYWLPLLTGRQTSVPASFYNYGDVDYAIATTRLAERASAGDEMTDAELVAFMEDAGATYVYVGPAADGKSGKLTPDRLRGHARLEEVYDRDGTHVFRMRSLD